jgi:medium-chain acyl-[acyl-carrier-protein] hydrolase
MYCPMSTELPPDWELLILDLPGRGKRHAEPLITTMPALIARVAEDVRPWLDVPVALFGHSLGAILAAEAARVCQRLGAPPVWVGISGRVAPTLQPQTRRLNMLDDASVLAEVIAMGAMPDRIGEDPELRARFLRIVRADLAVLDSYEPVPGRAALDCPMTAFSGTSDAWAPPAAMRLWARETCRNFRQRVFAGGHFYFLEQPLARVTRSIVREIEPYVETTSSQAASY